METKKITIQIPTLAVVDGLQTSYTKLKETVHNGFLFMQHAFRNPADNSERSFKKSFSSMGNGFKKFNTKKILMAIIPLAIVVILITVVIQTARSNSDVESVLPARAQNSNGEVISTKPLNTNFNFPLTNNAGKSIGEFSYEVQNAELRKEIIVKGQPASAVNGRVFLIVNLKLKNDLKQGLQINTRDYLRLSVNGNNEELLAPDIHNDPVEVQAISTKYTRVGFAINETDKNLKLIVGEIDGDKQDIPLSF